MLYFFNHHRAMFNVQSIGINSIETTENCDVIPGLVNRQIAICKRNLEVMDSVSQGAHISILECQKQFHNRRWNCSTVDPFTVFGPVLDNGEILLSFQYLSSFPPITLNQNLLCLSLNMTITMVTFLVDKNETVLATMYSHRLSLYLFMKVFNLVIKTSAGGFPSPSPSLPPLPSFKVVTTFPMQVLYFTLTQSRIKLKGHIFL